MNAKKFFLFAAMAFTAGVTTVKAQNADDIMKKHIEAMGGVDNWNKIKSLKLTGSMSANGMDIAMSQTTVNKKAMRMDISAMGQNGYTILTTTEGWVYMPFFPGGDKVTPIPAEELKGEQAQLNISANLFMDKSDYSKMNYAGMDTINSIPCYKLKVTSIDGTEQTVYVDASTYYVVRKEMTVKIQDQEQEVAFNFSNFQKQPEGVVYPMTQGTPQGDVTFKSIEINKPVDESLFKPAQQTPTESKK